ncbi:MAG TPA: hypothetical protein VFH27_06195 [Longimicrobiaceae bacterium]|nr:hypothetical protein [Longimicrobiaceae bacterium]
MMRTPIRAVLILAVLLLPGCDPLYTLGVRTKLSPAPASSCIEAALRASPGRTVHRSSGSDSTGFLIGMNGGAPGGPWNAALQVDRARDSTQVLSLQYWWMGTARTRPLTDQRQMVADGAALLTAIRAACAPASAAPIECYARGLDGSPACRPPA